MHPLPHSCRSSPTGNIGLSILNITYNHKVVWSCVYHRECQRPNYIIFLFFFSVLPVYCYQPISLHPRARMLSHVTPWTASARLLCPWTSPGMSTWVGCHFLLHIIFLHFYTLDITWSVTEWLTTTRTFHPIRRGGRGFVTMWLD